MPLLYKLENISDVLLRLQVLKFGDFYFSIDKIVSAPNSNYQAAHSFS